MIIYQETKKNFLLDVSNRIIEQKIATLFQEKMNRHPNPNEVKSWKNSLEEMYWVVKPETIAENSGITIEYNLPTSGKRIDFVISGSDKEGFPSAVLIELKQWEEAEAVKNKDAIVTTRLGKNPKRETVHPSYQVWSYLQFIKDFSELYWKKKVDLKSCAFLHNYLPRKINEPLLDKQYKFYTENAGLYFKGEHRKLTEFISNSIVKGDQGKLIVSLDLEDKKPSKSLQDDIYDIVNSNQEFVLLDTQKLVFEEAKHLYNSYLEDQQHRVLLVEGGPGTGKSVLAFQLLAHFLKNGANVRYVSKNAAVRQVYTEKLVNARHKQEKKIAKTKIQNLLLSSGQFIDASKDEYDILIVDEAHRLNAKSGIFQNKGENQIQEIINAAKFSVFFVDDNQIVTSSDIGSQNEIKKIALKNSILKPALFEMVLESQFRMNGSDGFLSWIDNLLGIKETSNIFYDKSFNYDFQIYDSIDQMYQTLKTLNNINNKTRMLAGYCWNWDSKKSSDLTDINLSPTFQKKWNLSSNDAWAIRNDSFDEIGCIHTSQGIEFDYVGVIIGADLKIVNGQLTTDPLARAKTDKSLRGLISLIKKGDLQAFNKANTIILNTYRVLLTRATKGCYVYFIDKELKKYFEKFMKK